MKKEKVNQTKLDDLKKSPVKENNGKPKNQNDKWNKVKSVNLKGKKVDADPDKESDKPIDILNEPGR